MFSGYLHNDMARLKVANKGDGLQIWRTAVNIPNEQALTADKGLSYRLALVCRTNTSHNVLPSITTVFHWNGSFDRKWFRIWTNCWIL